MASSNSNEKYARIIFFFILLALALLVLHPFIITIISAVLLSYIFYPLYKLLNKGLKKKILASLITTLLIILIIAVPAFFVVNKLTSEVYLVYLTSKQKLRTGALLSGECSDPNSFTCKINNLFTGITDDPQLQFYTETFLEKSRNFLVERISNLIFSIPKLILHLFVVLFTSFYLFIDGKKVLERFKKLLPFSERYQEKFIKKFGDVTHATVFGTIIIALIQGAMGALGLVIFGVKSPIIWGFVMAFFALVPFVGPGIVYVPASLFIVLNAFAAGNPAGAWPGVFLLLWGLLIVSSIDNILRPKIVGDRAHLHPVIVLLGVLGGLALMGFAGIILGPLVLAFLLTFMDLQSRKH